MKKRGFAVDMNAPVILWLTIIALAVLIIGYNRIGRLQNLGGRAIVLFEFNSNRPRKVFFKI